jgi:hypothetical protein
MVKLKPPSYLPADTPSDGERILFEKLAASKRGANWTVLHSLDIFPKSSVSQAEADFVVLAPGLGLLVVEVKAHREVKCVNGEWWMSGTRVKRSPVKQASNSVFFLMKHLETNKIDIRDIPVSFVVWFTHIPAKALPVSIEVNPAGWLGSEELLKDPVEVLSEVMKVNAAALGKNVSEKTAPVDSLKSVLEQLRPSFEARISPERLEADVRKWQDGALKTQIETVEILDFAQAAIIQGIAGTGKTHIALHEARKSIARSEKTLFVCFNKILSQHLKVELADSPLVHVTTLHGLLLEIANVKPPENANSEWWLTSLPKLAKVSLDSSPYFALYDTLIVDEAQDVCDTAYLEILDMLLVDGFQAGRVRLYGDFVNQGIYLDGADALENAKSAIPNVTQTPLLRVNCRNPENVGEAVLTFLDAAGQYAGYRRPDQGRLGTPVITGAGDDPIVYLQREMAELAKQYTPEQIVILTSSRENMDRVRNSIKSPKSELSASIPNSIRYGTVQEFKGMEAMAVIFIEFENTITPSWQNFYIAGTRAISSFTFILPSSIVERVQERK